jgi:NitT/TauT family transport system ATP-binding protein
MSALIELNDVTKDFTARGVTRRVLGPVRLHIQKHSFVALVGPSGCGKSTVLNLIAGMLTPSNGAVLYGSRPVDGPNQRVGYMTQKDTLLPWRSISDNIGISLELRCRHIGATERRDRIAQIIDLVGLKGFEQHYPGELSGGMRKRAALARMMIYEPETLLLDEPFGALDAQLKIVMHQELMRLVHARQMTTVFVTHDLGEAITLADQVAVFTGRPGRIQALRDVPLARPRDALRASFLPGFAPLYEDLWSELRSAGQPEEAARELET